MISDPDTLASMTLTAGSQLLGQALAPTPELPPELQQNVEAMAQELAILKEKDEAEKLLEQKQKEYNYKLEDMETKKKELLQEKLDLHQEKERSLVENLNKKYGAGTVDLSNGEFIPAK